MSKRQSSAPALPKPPTSLSSTVTISEAAILSGGLQVTIRGDTIVHPRAKLTSTHGSINIGSSCILSERSSIGLQSTSASQSSVTLEDYVVIEVGAEVEAKVVGEGTVIEVKAKIGKGATIGKHCKIGPYCTVEADEVVPDQTVIFGSNSRRIDNSGIDDLRVRMVKRQIDVLKKLIPNGISKWQ